MAESDESRAPQGTAVMPQKTAVVPQGTETMPQGTAVMPQGTAVLSQNTAVVSEKKGAAYAPGDTISVGGKNYSVTQLLGQGSEGDIYVVTDNNGRYALKLCHKGFHTNAKVMPALQTLNGKGYITDIVAYGDDFELLEYVPGGSAALAGIKGNAQTILAIAVKTAMTLDQMHKAGILHKDVKPANILIKDNVSWDSVLCDFGIAEVLDRNGRCTTRQLRTPIYASPEMYVKKNVVDLPGETLCELTPKSDFYSLGMTILSLWMGEGAFLSKEGEMAMAKNKGRISVPADMPDPLAKICRGLLIKNPEKRWDFDEIERTLKGEDVPVDEAEIIEDLNITYNASKRQTANSPEELAALMAQDEELAIKYLYRGQIEKWLKPYPELTLEIQDIVEKRYPHNQKAGLYAAIYTILPDYPFPLSGVSRETGRSVQKSARTFKDVGDFFNEALPDSSTMESVCSDMFKEWVRIRNSSMANYLPHGGNTAEVMMIRVQMVDPLSDINLRNDPSHPEYAMTQEGIGRFLNRVYHIFWNVCEGDLNRVKAIWDRPEWEPYNKSVSAATVACIAADFISPDSHHFIRDFFDTKGNRFEQQRSWLLYCTDRSSDDFRKKAGPKDDKYNAQAAWMKVIKGYGVTPEYELVSSGKKLTTHDDLHSCGKKELRAEYEKRGLRGFLAVQHQEDPNADLKPMFAYEKQLKAYLDDLRYIDDEITPVKRFDAAQKDADRILANGKSRVRGLSVRSLIQRVLTTVLAFIPGLVLLAMLVFSIIEMPLVDVSGMNLGKFMWIFGLVVAVLLFLSGDFDSLLGPIIAGVVVAVVLTLLVKLLGAIILYIYAAVVLAALIYFSIKTLFSVSSYARRAKKFTKPGFDEKVLEPLYYAFSNETSFDSSLNGAFNDDEIGKWKKDLKSRRKFVILFIGVTWLLAVFSIFIPKSERFEKLSAPVTSKVEKIMPAKEEEPETASAVYIAKESLKQGDKGEEVVKLQQFLRDRGYVRNAPDGSYGPGTRAAVAAFQDDYDLTVSGNADARTIKMINKVSATPAARKAAKGSYIGKEMIKAGEKSEDVSKLQKFLRNHGYTVKDPDGTYDSGTRDAIASFQNDYGLLVTGLASIKTIKKINQIAAEEAK